MTFLRLYWASEQTNTTAWFVSAIDEENAILKIEEFIGVPRESHEYFVTEILEIPERINVKNREWVNCEVLDELGFKILEKEYPRIVRYGRRIFKEPEEIFEIYFEESEELEIVYLLWAKNTDKYKIGVTKNLHKRIRSMQTGNPFRLILVDFIQCREPYELEKKLHEKHYRSRIAGEWFELDQGKLAILKDDFKELRKEYHIDRFNPDL